MKPPIRYGTTWRHLRAATRFGLAGALALSAFGLRPAPPGPAAAAGLIVNTTADASVAGDGLCTLREALRNANDDIDLTAGDCPAGSGADTLTFGVTGIISLTQVPATPTHALPVITSELTLAGPGAARLTVRVHANAVGVFAVGPGGVLALSGLTVADGAAATTGGGLSNDGGQVTIQDSVFANNRAIAAGGAIYSANGSLTVSGVTFSGNNTDGGGGAIHNASGALAIAGSAFTNNQADGDGGAVFGEAGVAASTFTGNSAGGQGGAIYSSALSVDQSAFTANSTGAGGGAVFVAGNGALAVTASTFTGNTAAGGGGGLYGEEGSQMTVAGSAFSANTAGGSGGAIYNTDGTLDVTLGVLTGNSAGGGGGAISGGAGSNTVLTSTLAGNSAEVGGGLITFSGLALVDSAVVSNTATLDGGGVYVGTDAGFAIANSTLSGNTAGRNGGGLFNSSGSRGGPLRHVTLYGNGAGAGGALYAEAGGAAPALAATLIVYSTAGGNCAGAGALQDNGANVQAPGGCGAGILIDDSTPEDCPMLRPLADNGGPTQTHALALRNPAACGANPALDTIPLAGCALATDQRGVGRPQATGCDIGAFEYGPWPPAAAGDSAVTAVNTPVTIAVLDNDTDPNPGEVLTVTAVTTPAHGAVLHDARLVTYTPGLDFSGLDVFTYTVSDGVLADSAVVSVTVLARLYLPIIRR